MIFAMLIILILYCRYWFKKLIRKPGERWPPKHWHNEADEAVEWTKNYLMENK